MDQSDEQTQFVDASVPPDVRNRVLAGAADELTRWGLERFDIAALAARHTIDASVIYRYWETRQRLVLDVLLCREGQTIVAPDTGSLRTDVHALTKLVARNLNTPLGRSLLRALVIDGRGLYSDETRMVFWRQRFDAVRAVLHRAAERGELRDGVDTVGAVQLTLAPINVRALYTADPIPDAYCEVIADLAWHAIAKR